MGDKKVFFPLLLCGIFFFLVAIAGFVQITIIKRNIEGLLREEGDTVFRSIERELEVNMEYLSLLEMSPSVITPNLLDVMAYDEAIVDDLYSQIARAAEADLERLPLRNLLVLDQSSRRLVQRGSIKVNQREVNVLLKKEHQSVITHEDRSLFMGMRLPGRLVFFRLAPDELDLLRKKYILKTIIDNEEKKLDITEINIYDGKGAVYLGSGKIPKMVLRLAQPLNSRYFPGYSVEILISNRLAIDTYRRTRVNFVTILLFLMLGGAAGIYVIFQLERRHAQRLSMMEKNMAMQERLVSLGRLASGMAHEIRNPLNAMGISIQRLKREFVPEGEKQEEYHQFLDIVRGEVQRVNRIVEDFLLSSKSGQPMERQHLTGIVEEVVTMLREKAGARGIAIDVSGDADIVLSCQKERLKQVFYNLITNSIEAMSGGGAIHISMAVQNRNASISIRDEGSGIRKEDLQRVFEYHYTTKTKGMGLGLPISYMIVKDHGGDIQAFSEEKGTTFVITLPLRDEER